MGRRQFTALARTEESIAPVKIADATTNSDVNATVIEVASGKGYLKAAQQLMTAYNYGTMTGYITVTVDGDALPELELCRAEFAGEYPGDLSSMMNLFYAPSIRYEVSLKVEHRFVKTTAGSVKRARANSCQRGSGRFQVRFANLLKLCPSYS